MAKIHTPKKTKRGNEVNCGKCRKEIEVGQMYQWIQKKNQKKQFRCLKPCSFRQSELTSGRRAEMLELTERLDDLLATHHHEYCFDDFQSEIDSIIDDARSLRDEIENSKDALPEQFQYSQQGETADARIEALEQFADDLESAKDSIDEDETDFDNIASDFEISLEAD